MFNKKGQLGTGTIILLVLGVLVLVGLLWGDSLQTNLLNAHNSKPNVDTIAAKCKTECGLSQKFDYCSAPKKLISTTETLSDVTCFKLAKEKPEYGIELCDKINCGEEEGGFTENPAEPGKPEEVKPTLTTTTCKEKYWDFITKYSSVSYQLPAIDPLLMFAILMKENSACDPTIIGGDGVSTGLMQVNVDMHCGGYGLDPDKIKCAKQLKDPETNIRVASRILRDKYSEFGAGTYSIKCAPSDGVVIDVSSRYKGWIAALRGYNGWPTSDMPYWSCSKVAEYVSKVKTNCALINNGKPCLTDDGKFTNI